MSDLIRALGALAEAPGAGHARIADALGLDRPPTRAEHTDLFLFQLYPYASVYVGPEGMLGGEGRDRVAGFWRALELVPPPEPDHLAALLGLYAELRDGAEEAEEAEEVEEVEEVRKDRGRTRTGAGREGNGAARAVAGVARAAFLREHIASWIFPWLDRAMEVAAEPYRAWAEILRQVLLEEVRRVGVAGNMAPGGRPGGEAGAGRAGCDGHAAGSAASGAPPPALPLHLREAPPLTDPRRGEGDFLSELLAPVRSGMILTRADLVRAGRELGLGVRIGERRYTLEALFGQAPAAVLDWLAGEAGEWARCHRLLERELGPVGAFWRERAEAAEALLEELAEAARTGEDGGSAPSSPRSRTSLEETHA